MLNMMSSQSTEGMQPTPKMPSNYSRDEQDDLKTAIDLLYKFKSDLDKLHPNVRHIVDKMLQRTN